MFTLAMLFSKKISDTNLPYYLHFFFVLVYVHWMKTSNEKFKMLSIYINKYFFSIKLLHAHLQYVCNIPAQYQMNILKALGGVDFTKYALLPISKYVQWSKIGQVKNAVNLSKKFFFCK